MGSNIQKKAFSLLEMSIVLTILALIMGIFLSFGKSIYETSKTKATKYELQTIKKSLISYMAVQGKLPQADTNGDGVGDTTGFGTLPYIDLSLPSSDKYGMVYQYDVSDSLISSDESNVCAALSSIYTQIDDINSSTTFPQMIDESNNSRYAVAAVIISKGVNKTLSGANSDDNRKYEMAINKYNADTRDDLVMELSALELIGTICDLSGSGGGDVVVSSPITITAVGTVHYNSDINATCGELTNGQSVSATMYEIYTFYQNVDTSCAEVGSKVVSMPYGELNTLDTDPNDNIVNVFEEINVGSPPTIVDN
ncbi:MAG: type II secretion system protein [Arcobacteraceae bacterium]|nr:type II secretion system protein [Arcobacteraceae bacterium]